MLTRSAQHLQRPCKEGRKSSAENEQKKQIVAMKEAGIFIFTLLKALQFVGFTSFSLSGEMLSRLPLIAGVLKMCFMEIFGFRVGSTTRCPMDSLLNPGETLER